MNTQHPSHRKTSEEGAALLIALFALLLISAVGVAMIVAAGTEGSLASNFRASTNTFYAAVSGVEEVRGRLSASSKDYLGPSMGFPVEAAGALRTVYYIRNPLSGETVDPRNTSPTSTAYPDTEYAVETGGTDPPATGTLGGPAYIPSTSPGPGTPPEPGPPYKWVRINGVTEAMLGIAVNGTSPLNTTTPLFFIGGKVYLPNPYDPATVTGRQVLEVTSLAVLPDGSRKMAQYIVTSPIVMSLGSALQAGGNVAPGPSLNTIGNVEQACTGYPSRYGIQYGGTLTYSQGTAANTQGTPAGATSAAMPPGYVAGLIGSLLTSDTPLINSTGTGVTGVGTPPTSYQGDKAKLGEVPTTVDPPEGDLTTVKGGTPKIYYSPKDLTIGSNTPDVTLSSPASTGYGVLMVDGDLTIDFTNGFVYYGLILVKGKVIVKANPGATTNTVKNIHGAIIAQGSFDATLMNINGGVHNVDLRLNPCLVFGTLNMMPVPILSFRELPQ